MKRDVPQIVLDLIEDWARDSIRKRPDRGWTGDDIIQKIKLFKKKSGWEEFMKNQAGARRKKDGQKREPGDPTPKQILEMARKLREARAQSDDFAAKRPAIREYRQLGDGSFEHVS